MEFEEIRKAVVFALWKLFANDAKLIEWDVHERSITHKLAIYIEQSFKETDVDLGSLNISIDCEYNRMAKKGSSKKVDIYNGLNSDFYQKKILLYYPENAKTTTDKAVTVYPDIIVHERGEKNNILVIEAKKSAEREDIAKDLAKLGAYLQDDHLKYNCGLFIDFLTQRYFGIKMMLWFNKNNDKVLKCCEKKEVTDILNSIFKGNNPKIVHKELVDLLNAPLESWEQAGPLLEESRRIAQSAKIREEQERDSVGMGSDL